MKDIEILEQLLNGNHLEPKEVERAVILLHGLNRQLESRL